MFCLNVQMSTMPIALAMLLVAPIQGTRVKAICEPLCRCWKLNLSPVYEQRF